MPTPSTSQVSLASQNGPMDGDHAVLLARRRPRQQDADAEVVAVQHDVGQDRQRPSAPGRSAAASRGVMRDGSGRSAASRVRGAGALTSPVRSQVEQHADVGDQQQRVDQRGSIASVSAEHRRRHAARPPRAVRQHARAPARAGGRSRSRTSRRASRPSRRRSSPTSAQRQPRRRLRAGVSAMPGAEPATASISTPMPTMTRKAKNTGATGG